MRRTLSSNMAGCMQVADTADDVARQLVDDAIQPLGKAVEENAQPIADRAKEDYIQAAADTIKDQVSSHTPLTHARRAPCRAWLAHSWWQPIAATAPDGDDNSVAASQPEGVKEQRQSETVTAAPNCLLGSSTPAD